MRYFSFSRNETPYLEKKRRIINTTHKGYNTRDHYDKNRFMGFYIDLTNIVIQENVEYHIWLDMPQLNPGQFQGLFLENIEKMFVEPL